MVKMNPAHSGGTNDQNYDWEEMEAGGPRLCTVENSTGVTIIAGSTGSVQATDSEAKTSDTGTTGASTCPLAMEQTGQGMDSCPWSSPAWNCECRRLLAETSVIANISIASKPAKTGLNQLTRL